MSNFSFTIENPATKPAGQHELYVEVANQLNFVFHNISGAPYIKPGNVVAISIPDNLIEGASADQLISKDWKVNESGVTHENGLFTYYLTPKQEIDFSDDITISLQKIVGKTVSSGQVNCSIALEQPYGSYSFKLIVSQKPDHELKSLSEAIKFNPPYINAQQQHIPEGKVYVSPTVWKKNKEKLTPPIANRIHINLKFRGKPAFEKWSGSEKPQFMFSFSYGSNKNDLTNAIKASSHGNLYNPLTSAWKIKAYIGDSESDRWEKPQKNEDGNTPVWIVEPHARNLQLFTRDNPNLDIYFEHVITDLAPGPATVYIQWVNIPGYNPGWQVHNLRKVKPEPIIMDLDSYSEGKRGEVIFDYGPEDIVALSWETFATDKVQLFWKGYPKNNDEDDRDDELSETFNAFPDSTPPSLTYKGGTKFKRGNEFPPPYKETAQEIRCRLKIPGSETPHKEHIFNLKAAKPPVITKFEVVPVEDQTGISLDLSWTVESESKIAIAYCEIDEVPGVFKLNDRYSIPLGTNPDYPEQFTLRVKGFSPEVTRVLKYKKTEVKRIDGFNVIGRQLHTNRLFLVAKSSVRAGEQEEKQIFYCDAMDIPDKLSESISLGSLSAEDIFLTMSPNGKQAIVRAYSSVPRLGNNKVFYFNPDNPPAEVPDTVDLMFPPQSVFFTPDNNWVYITAQDHDPRIAYFNPANPPKTGDSMISMPIENELEIKELAFSSDSKKAFWYEALFTTFKSYHFNPQHPPKTWSKENELLLDYPPQDIQVAPDDSNVFIRFEAANKVLYFPLDDIPEKPETSISINKPTKMLFFPEKNLIFVLCTDDFNRLKLAYFDWRNPSINASSYIFLSESSRIHLVNLFIHPNRETVYVTDYSNKKIYYFNADNPNQTRNTIDLSEGTQEMYFSLHGSRMFVNVTWPRAVHVFQDAYIEVDK